MRPAPPRPPRNHGLWLGPLVACVATISYFLYFARFPALRDEPWLNLGLAAAGAAVSAHAARRAWSRSSRWLGRALGLASVGLALVFAGFLGGYVFYLSYQLPAVTAQSRDLGVVPDFRLPDQNGGSVARADLLGRKALITFYRGHW